jgi:hypothetical protein
MRETGWRFKEDQDGESLVLTSRLIYIRKLALKRSLNYVRVMNPSTAILGIANVHDHVM